jgi:Amt family ammonium transporter
VRANLQSAPLCLKRSFSHVPLHPPRLRAYVMYAVGISSFIFPVVHHWVWSPQGWASYSRDEGPLLLGCGAIDFSGSGVVHCTGGLLAFIGAKLAEPRVGRFSPDGTPRKMVAQSPALVTLGTLILWVGWFFFNASGGGSFTGQSVVAARSMVNTAIAPAAAAMTSFVISYTLEKRFNMVTTTNSIISGLVAITAGCATVYTEGALLIGIIAAIVYSLASALMLRLRVDDVVDACAAHLFSGIWGLVATGLFTSKEGFSQSISSDSVLVDRCCGLFYGCSGHLLGANLIYLAALLAWVGVTGVLLFQTIKYTVGLRVSSEMEDSGMDKTRHGDTHASMRHAIARTLNAMGSHGVSTAVSRRPSMNSTTDQPVIPPNSSSANWG